MRIITCVLFGVLAVLSSCTSLDDVHQRLDKLEADVSDLQSAVKALQAAYDDGKIVKSVTPIEEGSGGWLITFSDDSSIPIYNGNAGMDAVSPQVRINPDSYHWELSVDNGLSWSDLDVVAKGQDAVSPQVQINTTTYCWEVSSDGGQTWADTGVIALGKDGKDGKDGDSFLESIIMKNGYVTFNLTDGSSFIFKLATGQVRLLDMRFMASANQRQLIDDVVGTIVGDSVVEFWIKQFTQDKMLVPYFTFDGSELYIDEKKAESGVTICDFSKPVKLIVRGEGDSKEYMVYVHTYTGLPVLWIETEGRQPITTKDNYLNAHFVLTEDVVTRAAGDVTEVDGQIKGRGNSTWEAPKKPYRLKFNNKVSFIDEPKDKAWVLLANYYDKTSIRNATAFYMSSISNLDYTPRFHFVEVMLNGFYNGTYQLGDKIKISKDRVNVGDDGFLLEIDAKAEEGEVTFSTSKVKVPFNIKEPELQVGDENYNYIKDYVTHAEEVLFSDAFTDPDKGWQKYMDMDSFVDWYLINEIARNNDAIFYTSCYLNLKRGGKLKMGPVWDFDIAFGNVNYNNNYEVEGLYIYYASWYQRLFQDPAFVAKVKERFMFFYDHQQEIMNEINDNANYLRFSVIENNNRWGTLYNIYSGVNYDMWGSYKNEVQHMKNWLQRRFEWLKKEYEHM